MDNNWKHPFWQGVFRDGDGVSSSSRLLTALVVIVTLAWVTMIVARTTALPELKPVESFLTATILSLYGVSRISQAVTAIVGKVKTSDTPCEPRKD